MSPLTFTTNVRFVMHHTMGSGYLLKVNSADIYLEPTFKT